jgi:hypothetical protein
MKIVDKMRKSTEEGTKFYSFEFFPPRTEEVQCSVGKSKCRRGSKMLCMLLHTRLSESKAAVT